MASTLSGRFMLLLTLSGQSKGSPAANIGPHSVSLSLSAQSGPTYAEGRHMLRSGCGFEFTLCHHVSLAWETSN